MFLIHILYHQKLEKKKIYVLFIQVVAMWNKEAFVSKLVDLFSVFHLFPDFSMFLYALLKEKTVSKFHVDNLNHYDIPLQRD